MKQCIQSKLSGPWIPCLKAGESIYTFTPAELSELINKTFHDGYQFAKEIYCEPVMDHHRSSNVTIIKGD